MPYVKRDGSGNIIELRRWPETPDHEFLAADHPDVVAYKKQTSPDETENLAATHKCQYRGGIEDGS